AALPVVAPRAAADDAIGAVVWPLRVAAVLAVVRPGVVPVGAPLPQVAVHVVQPQGVRLVLPHEAGAVEGVAGLAAVVGLAAREIGLAEAQRVGRLLEMEGLLRLRPQPADVVPAAAGVLPLGLRR